MKILLITEKCSPNEVWRDGGARLVKTIRKAFGDSLSIMQFGQKNDSIATWCFEYPFNLGNRFESRVINAKFIAEQVKKVEKDFTHLFFIHISMQFGLIDLPLSEDVIIWTFPMFLTPSYQASGEIVPDKYLQLECLTLANCKNIISPSYFEKHQLIDYYSISKERIHVIPRGVDTNLLVPLVRSLNGDPKFCSVGSIKPQKNTLGLINLFAKIQNKIPESKLKIIGPIQNEQYHKEVCKKINDLGLNKAIEFTGYMPANHLFHVIKDCHVHISRSTCETFGRSIFETLACGLPSIAKKTNNAAAQFLDDLPYAKFVDDDDEVLNLIPQIFANLSQLSSMALEIGGLYDDQILTKLLVAKICNNEIIAISDFDGTLFHKNDPKRTKKSVEEFKKFSKRVVCSARTTDDLLVQLKAYNLKVDWIISCGGAIAIDGNDKLLWLVPLILNEDLKTKLFIPETKTIKFEDKLIQIELPAHLLASLAPNIAGLRVEIYQNKAYIANWQASKLHAVHKLLKFINWTGQVKVFGDGKYDMELIKYFDGIQITTLIDNNIPNKELLYV